MCQGSPRSVASRWLCLLLVAVAGIGCHAPIRTVDVGPERTYEVLDANALNKRTLSSETKIVLARLDLAAEYDHDAVAAIRKLHAFAIEQPIRAVYFALAETSYLAAERGEAKDGYLAAAIYAYFYLFATDAALPPNPYGRNFRVACDIYNRGLLKALRSSDGKRFLFASGSHTLPVGKLDIRTDTSGFDWAEQVSDEYLPADNMRVIGLSSRRRDPGVGVPLIARLKPTATDQVGAVRVPPRASVAATAFLRIEGSLADLEKNGSARLELYSAFDVPTVKVGDQLVPLETDLTAPLAFQLGTAKSWSIEFGAFFGGSQYEKDTGLWTLQPYKPGKVPVVFVHGTASSPARWAEMFNELNADPDLRAAYRYYFFTYTTGNPVAYSAALLRDALTAMVAELDPEGKDPSLRKMVVIGHSQGGILAKMQVIHSGDAFWQNLERMGVPLDSLGEKDLETLRHYLVFDPQPDVKRVVFIATPQHGSFLAGNWLGRFIAGFISIPSKLGDSFTTTVQSAELLETLADKIPTSIANMTADNPFMQSLAGVDVAPGIPYHSIIAVEGKGPPDDLDDGLVQYKSAHLEHADSEFVVRSFHSCQANPHTVGEVRRILLEHLRAAKLQPAR